MTEEQGTPEHQNRVRNAKEREERIKTNVVKNQWFEAVQDGKVDANAKKGPKIILCQKMGSGNLQRTFIGRLKQCEQYLREKKREGVILKGFTIK